MPDALSETAKKATEMAGKAEDTRQQLDEMKKQVNIFSEIGQQLKEAAAEYRGGDKKEAMQKMLGIVSLAALQLLLTKEEEKKDEEGVTVTEAEEEGYEDEDEEKYYYAEEEDELLEKESEFTIDPDLVGKVDGVPPKCTRTKDTQEILADHQSNTKIMELLPRNKNELKAFLEKYKENKKRYEKVAKAVHIPAMLIASLHYMESSMNFDTYLHNGEKLGEPTTYVPKGVLFNTGQWEEAAIHALGGNIKDANGKPARKTFQNLRKELDIDENTMDIGKMLTFAERYNGLGYRYRGRQSCYVYGGTNVMTPGMYVADRKFNPSKVSKRIGVAAMVMGIQAEGAGVNLRVASTNKLLTGQPAKRQASPLLRKRLASNPNQPEKTKKLNEDEITPEVVKQAEKELASLSGKPVGTEVRRTIGGKTYVFQKQWHDNHPDTHPDGNEGIGVYAEAA